MEPSKPRNSDSLYIGCYGGTLLIWSIRQRKVHKDYWRIMTDSISAFITTADKKTLFLGDRNSHLKQISLRNHKVTHDYVRISDDPISSLTTTPDDKYLFVIQAEELQQYRIEDHVLLRAYQRDRCIESVATTHDNKHVFAGTWYGQILQICVDSQKFIYEYQNFHNAITTMALTRDNKL
jgi:WD40 repeat protein